MEKYENTSINGILIEDMKRLIGERKTIKIYIKEFHDVNMEYISLKELNEKLAKIINAYPEKDLIFEKISEYKSDSDYFVVFYTELESDKVYFKRYTDMVSNLDIKKKIQIRIDNASRDLEKAKNELDEIMKNIEKLDNYK